MSDNDVGENDALLSAARDGDSNAIRQLLNENLGFLKLQVKAARDKKGPDRDSDILQSTILRVLQGLPEFRGDNKAAFRAWSKQIVHNTVLEKRRFRSTGIRAKEILVNVTPEVADNGERASSEAHKLEKLLLISQGLRELNDSQRRAFELRIVDNCSYAIIARELEMSEAAARVQVSRARASLSLLLARHKLDSASEAPNKRSDRDPH